MHLTGNSVVHSAKLFNLSCKQPSFTGLPGSFEKLILPHVAAAWKGSMSFQATALTLERLLVSRLSTGRVSCKPGKQ